MEINKRCESCDKIFKLKKELVDRLLSQFKELPKYCLTCFQYHEEAWAWKRAK